MKRDTLNIIADIEEMLHKLPKHYANVLLKETKDKEACVDAELDCRGGYSDNTCLGDS